MPEQPQTWIPAELNENDLRALIHAAGLEHPAPEGLTLSAVLTESPVGPVKIRAYDSESAAQEIEARLLRLAGKILFPELLGRRGRYLIFRYLELPAVESAVEEPELYFQLGRFLGLLHAEPDQTGPEALDAEYTHWLEKLAERQILPNRLAALAGRAYEDLRPPDLPIRLDYFDAMPHNFGWTDDTLVLLDEKHLRPSFAGAGLVKPSFLCAPAQWQAMRSGYETAGRIALIEKHRAFLEFYYLTAALYFYALASQAGRIRLITNERFLLYRDWLIQKATVGQRGARLSGELHLYRAFPGRIPALLARRLHLTRKNLKNTASDW